MSTVTFTVDNSGNITGDYTGTNSAKNGDTLQVNNATGSSYSGSIYAARDNKNKTHQLVGQDSMAAGGSYTIRGAAKGYTFSITTTDPSSTMTTGAPLTTTNGTLHVGSGGNDDGDDDGDARRGGSGNS